MSLETVLEKNTAALEKHSSIMEQLLARLAAGVPASLAPAVQEAVAAAPKPAQAPAAASGKATAAAPAADAPTKTADAPSPAAASAEAAQPASTAAAEQLTYEQVKPWVTKLSAERGREAALAALGEFQATRGPELKPEQYGAFVARAKELLA